MGAESRRVTSISKMACAFLIAYGCQFTAEVHRDLTRLNDCWTLRWPLDIRQQDRIIATDHAQDRCHERMRMIRLVRHSLRTIARQLRKPCFNRANARHDAG